MEVLYYRRPEGEKTTRGRYKQQKATEIRLETVISELGNATMTEENCIWIFRTRNDRVREFLVWQRHKKAQE